MDSKTTQRLPRPNFLVSERTAFSLVAAFQVLSDDKGPAPVAPARCDHTAKTQVLPVFVG